MRGAQTPPFIYSPLTPLQLFHTVDIIHPTTGKHTTNLILGLVKKIHVRNDVVLERHSATAGDITKTVDATKYNVVARMGDITYTASAPFFRRPRPAWANDKETIEEAVKKANA